MTVIFRRRSVLPASPEEAFDRALDVDFHQSSFADSDEAAVGGVRHGGMGLNDTVTWRARHLGREWTMTSTISALDRPHRFVDEQLDGPFERFWHEHTFAPIGDDWTEMWDHVEFRAPLGPLGRAAELLALRWYMPRLIDIRNQALLEEFEQ